MELTFDDGNTVPPAGAIPDGDCSPTYGIVQVHGSKDTETLDLTGPTCNSFDGPVATITAGWAFDGPSTTTANALGQLKGTFKVMNEETLTLSLRGKAHPQ